MAIRLLSKEAVEVASPHYGRYTRTIFRFVGRFWQGPTEPGRSGRYVEETCSVSHARGRWTNCSAEYAERNGLAKLVK